MRHLHRFRSRSPNRRKCGSATAVVLALLAGDAAYAATPEPLQIYFIDVEGGQATLIVTPGDETLLIDAGWAGEGGPQSKPGDPATARDAGRVAAALRDAGVDSIDYLLVTHFHRDHIGGIPELTQLLPIRAFIDRGDAYPPEQRAIPGVVDPLDAAAYDAYVQVRARGRHIQPRPGDRLPLKGADTLVVSADRATLRSALPGAGETNESCMPMPLAAGEVHENPRSLGIVLTFGKFRFLDLGDLAGQPLFDLVCPTNRIGAVDLYLVAHHGGADASDPATFAAFRPRVAVINNSARKGGQRQTLQALRAAPGVETWQLHVSAGAGEDNASLERIANPDDDSAHWLKVTAKADGSFRIFNPRTGSGKEYRAR
jgi:competence protein ComEC